MKTMKQVLTLILTVVMLMSFAACTDSGSSANAVGGTSAEIVAIAYGNALSSHDSSKLDPFLDGKFEKENSILLWKFEEDSTNIISANPTQTFYPSHSIGSEYTISGYTCVDVTFTGNIKTASGDREFNTSITLHQAKTSTGFTRWFLGAPSN